MGFMFSYLFYDLTALFLFEHLEMIPTAFDERHDHVLVWDSYHYDRPVGHFNGNAFVQYSYAGGKAISRYLDRLRLNVLSCTIYAFSYHHFQLLTKMK
jgi:hypothetical protein